MDDNNFTMKSTHQTISHPVFTRISPAPNLCYWSGFDRYEASLVYLQQQSLLHITIILDTGAIKDIVSQNLALQAMRHFKQWGLKVFIDDSSERFGFGNAQTSTKFLIGSRKITI